MNTVATNIRFPKDEYRELKLLAYSFDQSVASLIRDAVKVYKKHKTSIKREISLAEQFKKISVKIDVPVLNLVKEGRKYE